MYRCEATSVEGFVQRLAVSFLPHGYWFYVTGRIPAKKDPQRVDQKLVSRYEIDISKSARARRKQQGRANMQYLRYKDFFVLLSTRDEKRPVVGGNPFFEAEAGQIRDFRRHRLVFEGYSISFRGGHSHVRIEQGTYLELKSYFLELAVHRSRENLEAEFARIRFEPYAPVRGQLFAILRAVNRARRQASYAPVSWESLRLRRRIIRQEPGGEDLTEVSSSGEAPVEGME